MEKGKAYLEQAVALEPAHAPAWVQLTDYYIAGCIFGQAPPRELWPKAKDAAQRAVAADPEYADAQAALAFVLALSEHKWTDALERFATALRLNPASARAHFWRGQTLRALGRTQESCAGAQRALDLDPLFVLYRLVIAQDLLYRCEYKLAADHARQMLDIDPHYVFAQCVLGENYCRTGRHTEGIALLENGIQNAPGEYFPMGFLGWAYVGAGRRGDAERFLARLEEKRQRKHVAAATLASVTLALGDVDGAWKWLDQAVEEHDPNLMYITTSPEFEPLHSDPRYRTLLRRMNLA
jgi:tetratricopeptide (TPR) repeat protein